MPRKLTLATPAERAEHGKRLQTRKAREQREQQELVRRLEKADRKLKSKEFDVLVIPSGFKGESALSVERTREYSEHLRKMIREADDVSDAVRARTEEKMRNRAEINEARFVAEPMLRNISDRLCGVCRGGCCTHGGDSAFITRATIRRVREQMPELSDDDILEAYLSRLPSRTITGACINQASDGCALPAEMRSDTCNGFFCDSLSDWLESPTGERADQVLAIQRSECVTDQNDLKRSNHIVDVALVNAEKVQFLSQMAGLPAAGAEGADPEE
jgi:hypothetical protein